jgi:hypothetical protein
MEDQMTLDRRTRWTLGLTEEQLRAAREQGPGGIFYHPLAEPEARRDGGIIFLSVVAVGVIGLVMGFIMGYAAGVVFG